MEKETQEGVKVRNTVRNRESESFSHTKLFFYFQDSSVLAQLGWPDMRLPILYTMSWPERIYCSEFTWPRLDLCKYCHFPLYLQILT